MLLQGCLIFPYTHFPSENGWGLYIKVYVVHVSVLKEAVVVSLLVLVFFISFKVGWQTS